MFLQNQFLFIKIDFHGITRLTLYTVTIRVTLLNRHCSLAILLGDVAIGDDGWRGSFRDLVAWDDM